MSIFSRKSRAAEPPPQPHGRAVTQPLAIRVGPASRPQSGHIGGYSATIAAAASWRPGCDAGGSVALRRRPQLVTPCPAHGSYGLSPRKPPPPPAGVAPRADFYGSYFYPGQDDRRSSAGSQRFATVANRLSFAFEVGSLPQLVTNLPADAAQPPDHPIPTPPPTPPVRPAADHQSRASQLSETPIKNSWSREQQEQQQQQQQQQSVPGAIGSLTSIVQFMRRTNSTCSADSQFKVTLRKSRSRSRRSRDLPRLRFLPALSRSPSSSGRGYEVIDSHPTVLYRPRYFAQRRSLVEGLEKLHLFGELDPEDGLDLLDDPSERRGSRRRRQRRDSCPSKLLGGDGADDFGRSASDHGNASQPRRIGEVRQEASLRRRCRTFSRPRDGPLPKSPLPVPRRDRSQHAFYFFHVRTWNLAQTESFLFDTIVTLLARRHSCTLRLLPQEEAQDLPDGLRRVEVAGPSLKDIKRFLYYLTTSEETVSLQRQIQERYTLSRGLTGHLGGVDVNGGGTGGPSPAFSARLWRANSVSATTEAATDVRLRQAAGSAGGSRSRVNGCD
ncbi:hypothetical protein BOX15_Mlig026437g1 [Macrostomum lignano]|uniref:Uncharacterized protein n=1 Tax=Macrostomum lignano TaxID=282301 RepID=A0A267E868_9PLAT|nr:hypothetical protein BOX15_Mlig026437g2 [Macrostomum lignano]PAA67826.1 hypothetical protein BOX15_Mlig026437g1 [Macrostomum lignano]